MTSALRALLLGLGVLAGASAIARAQEPPPAPRAAEALRVFLDCRTTYCDFDYVRTEVNFVNYVRDPVDAQIFVLVTTESTGGGGTQFTVNLLGRQDFTGRNDTLFYVSQRSDTYDEVRRGLTQTLKLGLVRYAARSVLAERIQITYAAPPGQPDGNRQRHDPWDYWVFNTGMSGNFSGEQSRHHDVPVRLRLGQPHHREMEAQLRAQRAVQSHRADHLRRHHRRHGHAQRELRQPDGPDCATASRPGAREIALHRFR